MKTYRVPLQDLQYNVNQLEKKTNSNMLKLEGAQRVHMSTKWIFYSFYRGLGGRWCPVKTESLSRAILEITGLNDIGITTLTLKGHVTSSMTSSFDLS